MGYETFFTLQILDVTENEEVDILHDLAETIPESAEFGSYWIKYYDYHEDFMKFSTKYPNAIFELLGEGEERDDSWCARYQNGILEHIHSKQVWQLFEVIQTKREQLEFLVSSKMQIAQKIKELKDAIDDESTDTDIFEREFKEGMLEGIVYALMKYEDFKAILDLVYKLEDEQGNNTETDRKA